MLRRKIVNKAATATIESHLLRSRLFLPRPSLLHHGQPFAAAFLATTNHDQHPLRHYCTTPSQPSVAAGSGGEASAAQEKEKEKETDVYSQVVTKRDCVSLLACPKKLWLERHLLEAAQERLRLGSGIVAQLALNGREVLLVARQWHVYLMRHVQGNRAVLRDIAGSDQDDNSDRHDSSLLRYDPIARFVTASMPLAEAVNAVKQRRHALAATEDRQDAAELDVDDDAAAAARSDTALVIGINEASLETVAFAEALELTQQRIEEYLERLARYVIALRCVATGVIPVNNRPPACEPYKSKGIGSSGSEFQEVGHIAARIRSGLGQNRVHSFRAPMSPTTSSDDDSSWATVPACDSMDDVAALRATSLVMLLHEPAFATRNLHQHHDTDHGNLSSSSSKSKDSNNPVQYRTRLDLLSFSAIPALGNRDDAIRHVVQNYTIHRHRATGAAAAAALPSDLHAMLCDVVEILIVEVKSQTYNSATATHAAELVVDVCYQCAVFRRSLRALFAAFCQTHPLSALWDDLNRLDQALLQQPEQQSANTQSLADHHHLLPSMEAGVLCVDNRFEEQQEGATASSSLGEEPQQALQGDSKRGGRRPTKKDTKCDQKVLSKHKKENETSSDNKAVVADGEHTNAPQVPLSLPPTATGEQIAGAVRDMLRHRVLAYIPLSLLMSKARQKLAKQREKRSVPLELGTVNRTPSTTPPSRRDKRNHTEKNSSGSSSGSEDKQRLALDVERHITGMEARHTRLIDTFLSFGAPDAQAIRRAATAKKVAVKQQEGSTIASSCEKRMDLLRDALHVGGLTKFHEHHWDGIERATGVIALDVLNETSPVTAKDAAKQQEQQQYVTTPLHHHIFDKSLLRKLKVFASSPASPGDEAATAATAVHATPVYTTYSMALLEPSVLSHPFSVVRSGTCLNCSFKRAGLCLPLRREQKKLIAAPTSPPSSSSSSSSSPLQGGGSTTTAAGNGGREGGPSPSDADDFPTLSLLGLGSSEKRYLHNVGVTTCREVAALMVHAINNLDSMRHVLPPSLDDRVVVAKIPAAAAAATAAVAASTKRQNKKKQQQQKEKTVEVLEFAFLDGGSNEAANCSRYNKLLCDTFHTIAKTDLRLADDDALQRLLRSVGTDAVVLGILGKLKPKSCFHILSAVRTQHVRRLIARSNAKHVDSTRALDDMGLRAAAQKNRNLRSVFVNPRKIARYFDSLKFPLFLLDFETLMPPLPFFAKGRPYQNIAFQFSLDVYPTLESLLEGKIDEPVPSVTEENAKLLKRDDSDSEDDDKRSITTLDEKREQPAKKHEYSHYEFLAPFSIMRDGVDPRPELFARLTTYIHAHSVPQQLSPPQIIIEADTTSFPPIAEHREKVFSSSSLPTVVAHNAPFEKNIVRDLIGHWAANEHVHLTNAERGARGFVAADVVECVYGVNVPEYIQSTAPSMRGGEKPLTRAQFKDEQKRQLALENYSCTLSLTRGTIVDASLNESYSMKRLHPVFCCSADDDDRDVPAGGGGGDGATASLSTSGVTRYDQLPEFIRDGGSAVALFHEACDMFARKEQLIKLANQRQQKQQHCFGRDNESGLQQRQQQQWQKARTPTAGAAGGRAPTTAQEMESLLRKYQRGMLDYCALDTVAMRDLLRAVHGCRVASVWQGTSLAAYDAAADRRAKKQPTTGGGGGEEEAPPYDGLVEVHV